MRVFGRVRPKTCNSDGCRIMARPSQGEAEARPGRGQAESWSGSGLAWPGLAWPGPASPLAQPGSAWLGLARPRLWLSLAWPGPALYTVDRELIGEGGHGTCPTSPVGHSLPIQGVTLGWVSKTSRGRDEVEAETRSNPRTRPLGRVRGWARRGGPSHGGRALSGLRRGVYPWCRTCTPRGARCTPGLTSATASVRPGYLGYTSVTPRLHRVEA